MQNTPMRNYSAEQDYDAGFRRIMWLADQARLHGWRLSERQLIHEIMQRERAAHIREKSSLPMVGSEVHSAAWNYGQAAALRALLRSQNEENS
jgi:hypothetical protein